MNQITFAVKCAPNIEIFKAIKSADIKAVELFLSKRILSSAEEVIKLCKEFDFKYALHCPNDAFMPEELRRVADGVNAGVIVCHDIFWEDEWLKLFDVFKNAKAKICIENIKCCHDSLKFERRFNTSRCVDLEHLQMEASGVFEEHVVHLLANAGHIHITGYKTGSQLWHTHIHSGPKEHLEYMLDLILRSGYKGMVVSEAEVQYQTANEFRKAADFFENWKKKRGVL